MFKSNVDLLAPIKLSSWRKVSLGSWKPIGDSQVYGELIIETDALTDYIRQLNQQGHRVTVTHVVGKIFGRVLKEVPHLNSVVRWGRVYPRRHVDVFFHVVDGDDDLSGHVIRQIDRKPITEIAQELNKKARTIKDGEDVSFKKIKDNWKPIPGILAKCVLDFIGLIFYNFNIYVPGLGIQQDCFGSMMITNIGSLGFSQGYVPLPPYTRVPLIVALGKVEERPLAINGQVVARNCVGLYVTFDHRLMDGAHGAKMVALLKKYFKEPALLDL